MSSSCGTWSSQSTQNCASNELFCKRFEPALHDNAAGSGMSQLWYLLARWSWKISWRQILYVHIGVKCIYLSIGLYTMYNLSMLNRLVLHGRVIGAAWWQRGGWLIGRVVATWCLVAFWKQVIFCVVLSISVHLKLTSALSYSGTIMWTQRSWRQCIKSKRV